MSVCVHENKKKTHAQKTHTLSKQVRNRAGITTRNLLGARSVTRLLASSFTYTSTSAMSEWPKNSYIRRDALSAVPSKLCAMSSLTEPPASPAVSKLHLLYYYGVFLSSKPLLEYQQYTKYP